MVARGRWCGHPVHFDPVDKVWRYDHNNEIATEPATCKHCGHLEELLLVPREDYDDPGTIKGWHYRHVDHCIVPLVRALNSFGMYTTNSCCGHGTGPTTIFLLDGRVLTIETRKEWERRSR